MFQRKRTMRATAPSHSRESGQALLELALVVPMLVLLVMAIFQFAYVMESQIGLTNALREAGRRVAATTTAAPTWTGAGSLQQWVQGQLCGDLTPPCDGGLLAENVQGFDGARLVVDPPTVTFCSYPLGTGNEYQVNLNVQYAHPLFFGPMAFATDAMDGVTDGAWTISASAQMRMENIDEAEPGFSPPGVSC